MANQIDPADAAVCDTWASVAQVQSIGTKYDGLADDAIEDGVLIASDLLFHLTGRVFPGTCADVVRPCARQVTSQTMVEWAGGDDVGPASWGACACGPLVGCTCQGRPRIGLGREPIVSITAVKVDGGAINPARYWVEDERWLVRLDDADGSNPGWPACQDLTLPDTAVDTFSVSFVWGRTPPAGGQMAAAQLGGEIALDLSGSSDCSLADGVTSMTRQGVTIEAVVPSAELVDQLPELARAWVRSVNPLGLRRRPSVWWPRGREVARVNT